MTATRRPVVALVTDAIHPFHRGGKETRYHELAHRLARHAEVHVYTMRWWEARGVRRDGSVTFHALCPLLPLYRRRRRSIVQAVVFALGCLGLVFRDFDVIEADHMPYMQLFPLRIVATLRRRPLVVTWHECWGPEYWREYLGPAGRIGWGLERLAMRLPDRIIAASPETGARLREQLGDRVPIVVAPNGIDVGHVMAIAPAADACDLVVVSRLLRHKRVDLLLDAVALMAADGETVTCRVIGDGPEREALALHARELGIERQVEFRDDVGEHDELFALLKAARVFVFPSEREGFGIAALEALACGLPVVTTSAPDNLARHLVARSARGVVCAPEAAALARAIAGALDGGGRSAAVEPWVREHDWDAVTDRVAEAVLG